ncbi:hypothetical protein POM88_038892 [Heracleum sosnowskyi]|uniref:Uncharacterized protein n=1 Tax=Heracleum sosnowskyi TaxID=360622 RepID=A0AAD8M7C2_9APIA|nr:hypothetical protein POM88_038892 [Heracleum sosnowskyi]
MELEFQNCNKKTSAFKKLIHDCKERRITVRETESRTDRLFNDHPDLYTNFYNTVLSYLYPVSTGDEVDKANQFIHIVEFQHGRLSLKDMTVKVTSPVCSAFYSIGNGCCDDADFINQLYIHVYPADAKTFGK